MAIRHVVRGIAAAPVVSTVMLVLPACAPAAQPRPRAPLGRAALQHGPRGGYFVEGHWR